jgi:hypothetical protein
MTLRIFLAVAIGLLATLALPAHAQFTGTVDLATISMTNATTPRLTAGNVCVTDGTDVLCDRGVEALTGGLLVATRVSATNISATNISATRISGDGSGLTNLPAGATPDRIISSTSNVIVNSATGVISLTQLGTATAYLHPTLGYVGPGVSTTGAISGTNIRVIGTDPLISLRRSDGLSGDQAVSLGLDVSGTMYIQARNDSWSSGGGSVIRFLRSGSNLTFGLFGNSSIGPITMIDMVNNRLGVGITSATTPAEVLHVGGRSFFGSMGVSRSGILFDPHVGLPYARIHAYDYGLPASKNLVLNPFPGGIVGIATFSPTVSMDVNGTIRMASGGEACDADRTGAIR